MQRIETLALVLTDAPEFITLADFLGALVADHGSALLRVKGIVQVRGEQRPLAVHGVQHVFHPPTRLAAWPAGLEQSVLVFITDGLAPAIILERARAAGLAVRELSAPMEFGHVA